MKTKRDTQCLAFILCKKAFHRVPNLKGPENTLFSRFYFHLALATLFSPPFDFKTSPRHSFLPFSKLIGTYDTLFGRFQNHLGLARVFWAVFKTDWRCNDSFWPLMLFLFISFICIFYDDKANVAKMLFSYFLAFKNGRH